MYAREKGKNSEIQEENQKASITKQEIQVKNEFTKETKKKKKRINIFNFMFSPFVCVSNDWGSLSIILSGNASQHITMGIKSIVWDLLLFSFILFLQRIDV